MNGRVVYGLSGAAGMVAAVLIVVATAAAHVDLPKAAAPGGRVLLDAHNCYPEHERWADRIDRALGAGTPVAIEQDLFWYTDPATGKARSIVTHGEPYTGREPSLEAYFFERVRPIVERALREQHTDQWPLIVLNLDLKSNEPAHHAAIWQTLARYESWLTTAGKRDAEGTIVHPLDVKPILVLTGNPDAQEQAFFTSLTIGSRLRVFGAIRAPLPPRIGEGKEVVNRLVDVTPEEAIPGRATNYRRWVNFPWAIVERGGQNRSEEWTAADRARLTSLVDRAHAMGLWIRFYTLNGHEPADNQGWTASYNFGSASAARARWEGAIEAGVDFIATDQYEAFAKTLNTTRAAHR